jgi:hypothetical protein
MMSAVPTATVRGRVYCGRSQHHRSEATQEQHEFCAHRLFLGVYTLYTPKREESRYFPPGRSDDNDARALFLSNAAEERVEAVGIFMLDPSPTFRLKTQTVGYPDEDSS